MQNENLDNRSLLHLGSQAVVLATCLHYEIITIDFVRVWADRKILASDVPEYALVEISLSHSLSWKFVDLLSRIGVEERDFERELYGVLKLSRELLRTEAAKPQLVAKMLFDLAIKGEIPASSLRKTSFWFDDEYDLLGYKDTTEPEITRLMTQELDQWLEENCEQNQGVYESLFL